MDSQLLMQIIQELQLSGTPPYAIHSDISNSVVYIIYKIQNKDTYLGFPVLKITSINGGSYTSDVITKGFLTETGLFDITLFNSNLITALNSVTFTQF
jgi:hypothetical protein